MNHLPLNVRVPIELENPSIMRDEDLCIKCGKCSEVCQNLIAVHGSYTFLDTENKAVCINCGQCANVCPTNSITEKYEYEEVIKAINDPKKIVIFSTSPSVRVALGEEFGLNDGSFVQGKMVSLLRKLGANYVLDTNFAADLTIMEEASELIERITKETGPLPQFTSCCPAWVKYVETYYPEMVKNLSTAKSPIGMQGPTIKTYFAKANNLNPLEIVNVAVTPCTAKKMEIRREEMNASSKYLNEPGLRDMDYVITTRELAKWAKESKIDFASLEDSDYDRLMGEASGAGVIFGNTGGVMEAALRTAYKFLTGKDAARDFFTLTPVRGYEGIREATLKINDLELKVAVAYGTANAKKLVDEIKEGKKTYHFMEVMTCPGGCIGGGGQPKNLLKNIDNIRKARIESLYKKDNELKIHESHNNLDIIKVYEDFYQKPLSKLAEEMLHTIYEDKSFKTFVNGKPEHKLETETKELQSGKPEGHYVCTICGYEVDGPLPADYVCPICGKGVEFFEEVKEEPKEVIKDGKIYRCSICGYEVEGPLADDFVCPICGKGKEFFEEVKEDIVEEVKPVEKVGKPEGHYACSICGYEVDGPLPADYVCPICGKGVEFFEEVKEEPKEVVKDGKIYRCSICGYEVEGPLSDDFVCPICGKGKEFFEEVKEDVVEEIKEEPKETIVKDGSKYRCELCGYEVEGPLSDDFVCPICGGPKSVFQKIE